MFLQNLQELLGAYMMPVLIAIPLAVIVIIAALKRDDYRRPPPPRSTRRPLPPRPTPEQLGIKREIPPLPDFGMASPLVTAPTPMAPPPPPAPLVPPPGPSVVVVADDSAVVRTKLKRLLEANGYEVLAVNDGVEASAAIEARPEVAVLITDLEMPNKDGFELIADLHGGLATEDLPIIAITGHDELHGRVGQIEGVFGIFKKPWVDRELLKRVDSLKHLRLAAARRNRRATDLRTS